MHKSSEEISNILYQRNITLESKLIPRKPGLWDGALVTNDAKF
jgi:hypothetical protein